MKIKYLILILLVILIFSLFGCGYSITLTRSPETNEKTITTETIKNYIDVKYIVIGITSVTSKNKDNEEVSIPIQPRVSVTYSNSQGGTEQISEINLQKTRAFLGLPEDKYSDKFHGEIIADYPSFPIDAFMHMSAQNQNDIGGIVAIIMVNGNVWKSSVALGGYAIAEASGVFRQ